MPNTPLVGTEMRCRETDFLFIFFFLRLQGTSVTEWETDL